MARLLTLILVVSTSVLAQNAPSDFVLDKSKPYAYLEFDHAGPRKPYQTGEGNAGLWLRVVNNCRIPIVLRSTAAPEGETGVILEDQVVPNGDQETRDKWEALKHIPEGYYFEFAGIEEIQPGKDLLFSVPANHVSANWYMRVRFAFDFDRSAVWSGPFTYLEFHDSDIPKK
jgi:hypothetical protein